MQSTNPVNSSPGLKVSLAPLEPYDKVPSDPIDATKNEKPHRTDDGWYVPSLSVTVADVTSAGARKFLSSFDVPQLLEDAVVCVAKRLYGYPVRQPVDQRSITLLVRKIPGVAYTAGPRKSKQIHLSSAYIATLSDARLHDEILGVIRHQMAHALQHDGDSTAPMGLIEGIADWVQLCDGVVHSSWESGGGDDSGEGYQYTAHFLEWLCARYGEPMVKDINAYLGKRNYAKSMWRELFGVPVEVLWTEYKTHCDLCAFPPAEEKRPAVCNHTPQEPVVISTVAGDTVDNTAYRAAPASPHERTLVIVDQETEATAGVESLASASSESEFDPFPYHTEAAMVDIFSARLRALTYDGSRDAGRFVKEFEALVARINPQIRDEDKRLLLTTAFVGDFVNNWYEETDLDDDLPYAILVERLQQQFKGGSRRKMGIIDRDAKLS